ncbi:MAG TPA: hypothetical protein PKD74_01680 [Candidatus Dependentiae bacterium]|nr:hypothetical protein [Candidatus Dependentiae bacterium]
MNTPINFWHYIMVTICLPTYVCCTTTLETIDQYIRLLDDQIILLKTTTTKLKDSYDLLNEKLIGTINQNITNVINPANQGIEEAQKTITKIPQAVLTVAAIGDLPDALQSTKTLLSSTSDVLNGVKNKFTPIISSLNPTTDNKKIYSKFNTAIVELTKAKEALIKFRRACELFGI